MARSLFQVDNSSFTANTAAFDGGGLFAQATTIDGQYVTATNNTAGFSGGGISLADSSGVLNGLSVLQNAAMHGGGMHVGRSSTFAASSLLVGMNWAERRGGGLFVGAASSLACSNASMTHNTALEGGGLFAQDAKQVWVSSSTVSFNDALDSGAGVGLDRDATVQLVSCKVTRNTALGDGGAAHVAGYATLNVAGCEVDGNSAGRNGGGVSIAGSTPGRLGVFVQFDGELQQATTARELGNRTESLGTFLSADRHGSTVPSLARFGCINSSLCNETLRPGAPPRETASLTAVGSLFRDNYAGLAGGAVSTVDKTHAHVDMWDTMVSGNTAWLRGGGLSLSGTATANVTYVRLDANQVLEDGMCTGGGMDIRTNPQLVRRYCGAIFVHVD